MTPRAERIATGILAVVVAALAVHALAPRPDLTVDTPTDAERCAELNGAPLDARACAAYLAEVDVVAAWCGGIVDGRTWGGCADDVLAAHRAGAPCGLVAEVEDGVTTYLPASCSTEDELADRLDRVREGRPSPRFGS